MYVVAIDSVQFYAVSWEGFETSKANYDIIAPPRAGVISDKPNTFPTGSLRPKIDEANFFVDIGFQRTKEPTEAACDAWPTAPTVTIFGAEDEIGEVQKSDGKTPFALGVHIRASMTGYFTAIRWFKVKRRLPIISHPPVGQNRADWNDLGSLCYRTQLSNALSFRVTRSWTTRT
jgi:hypothetical protein